MSVWVCVCRREKGGGGGSETAESSCEEILHYSPVTVASPSHTHFDPHNTNLITLITKNYVMVELLPLAAEVPLKSPVGQPRMAACLYIHTYYPTTVGSEVSS